MWADWCGTALAASLWFRHAELSSRVGAGWHLFLHCESAGTTAHLLVDNVSALRDAFRSVHAARPFTMIAIVILPDHLHCIWRLPDDDADNAIRWRQIKTLFSQRLPRDEWRS